MLRQARVSPLNYKEAARHLATQLKSYSLVGTLPSKEETTNPWEVAHGVYFLFVKQFQYYVCSAQQLLQKGPLAIELADGDYIYVKLKLMHQENSVFRLRKNLRLSGHLQLVKGFEDATVTAAGEIFFSQGKLILYNNKSSNFMYSIAATQREINEVFKTDTATSFFDELEDVEKILLECYRRQDELMLIRRQLDAVKMECKFLLVKSLVELALGELLTKIDVLSEGQSKQNAYLTLTEKNEINKCFQTVRSFAAIIQQCRSEADFIAEITKLDSLLEKMVVSGKKYYLYNKTLSNIASRLQKTLNVNHLMRRFNALDKELDQHLETKGLILDTIKQEAYSHRFNLIAHFPDLQLQTFGRDFNTDFLVEKHVKASNQVHVIAPEFRMPRIHSFYSKASLDINKPKASVELANSDNMMPHLKTNGWVS
ncbi:MAG: hypothetical protein P4M14_07425 [Gammaproteobacteria bacterium]|nr:hypothetical protein [Gammaproteobacteria bacterium]